MQLQTIMAYVFSLAPPFTPCSPLRKKWTALWQSFSTTVP
jgi:hypothetical protein